MSRLTQNEKIAAAFSLRLSSLSALPVLIPLTHTFDGFEHICLEFHRLENVTRSFANGVGSRKRME